MRQVLHGRRPWWDRQGCFFVDPSWVEPTVDSRNRYPSWVEVSINVDVRYHHLSEPRIKNLRVNIAFAPSNSSLYILATCITYFPLLIYSCHACLSCIVNVQTCAKTPLQLKEIKNCNFSHLVSNHPPPLDTSSRSFQFL